MTRTPDPELAALVALYRIMPTEELRVLRAAFDGDLNAAWGRGDPLAINFCMGRMACIDDELVRRSAYTRDGNVPDAEDL